MAHNCASDHDTQRHGRGGTKPLSRLPSRGCLLRPLRSEQASVYRPPPCTGNYSCLHGKDILYKEHKADITHMQFPVIIIPQGKRPLPFLATTPSSDLLQDPHLLTSRGAAMRHALFYSMDGVYKIEEASSCRKASLWNLLFHRNDPDFWNLKIRYSKQGAFALSDLIGKLEESIEKGPCDVWMQYHEKEVILHLLRACTNMAEVIAVGCLIGIWEPDKDNQAHLPEAHDNSDEYDPETMTEMEYITSKSYSGMLSRSSIQQLAAHIRFDDAP